MTTLVVAAGAMLLLVVVAIWAMTRPARGCVILLGLDFGRRDRYTLVLEIGEASERLDLWPGDIPRAAAYLLRARDGADFELALTSHGAMRLLVIPAWALPEARRLLANVAVSMLDPYEYQARQAGGSCV